MQKENDLISDIKENFGSLMNARSLAVSNDKRILEFLLESSNLKAEYKERFFETHCGALIFKKDDFLNFLDLKLLSASYTSFSNKIGIGTSEKKFLKNTENVVLNYPFKDCVLKGGQKSDDEKSTEIFFNNILAKSEIDVLFSPKVLCNFELIGELQNKLSLNHVISAKNHVIPAKAGISSANEIVGSSPTMTQGSSPTMTQGANAITKSIESALKNNPNLLIKGNNLIALHCLKYKYAKQVKLIYIDPPYNTGNDSFNYNDRFNHSTYLCFMKNRLEIARELLRDDGVIFVQCDDNEQAYLKVLMDEIFGRENFVACMPRKTSSIIRVLCDYEFQKIHDYILVYSKNKILTKFKKSKSGTKEFPYSDEKGSYLLSSLQNSGVAGTREARPNLYFPVYEQKDGTLQLDKDKNTIKEILPSKVSGKDGRWLWSKERFSQYKEKIVLKNGKLFQKRYKDEFDEIDNYQAYKTWLDEFPNAEGSKEVGNVIGQGLFSFPKSEKLLQYIIEISTNENDLVLDFFAGSGTTLAVAHKMKRKYIGIEQMDYIESITKERLKKVIDGESGGISKAVEWSGGGSFIYCELAPLNASFIEKIENSRDENELNNIYKDLQKLAFIDYRVDIQNDLKDSEFGALSFEEKKRILKKCLDRNMDYIPYADIDDIEYKIDEQTRILNDIFYKKVEMI